MVQFALFLWISRLRLPLEPNDRPVPKELRLLGWQQVMQV